MVGLYVEITIKQR